MRNALGSIVEVSLGYPFRTGIKAIPGATTAVVQMRDTSCTDGIDWPSCVRTELPGKREPDWLKPGDILFPTRGNLSCATLVDETIGDIQAVAAPHFFVLRLRKTGVLPAYVAWWLNQEPAQRHLEQQAQSSGIVRNVSRAVLDTIPIAIPPLPHQQQITELAQAMRREAQLLHQLMQSNQQIMTGLARDLMAH
nr:restriction endonuclease subunit S [Novacetimonas pomaceti]